jgi:PIN domain nuclease of toxin-antitoxin system
VSLLLDSNALVWWLDDNARLARQVERIEAEAEVGFSVVSPWELWIKAAIGKFQLPRRFDERLATLPLAMWSPSLDDARLAASLPLVHRDPFDRMIIAQALNRQATVITGDAVFARYGVDVILA